MQLCNFTAFMFIACSILFRSLQLFTIKRIGINRGRKLEEEREGGAPGAPVHAAAPSEQNWAPPLAAATTTTGMSPVDRLSVRGRRFLQSVTDPPQHRAGLPLRLELLLGDVGPPSGRTSLPIAPQSAQTTFEFWTQGQQIDEQAGKGGSKHTRGSIHRENRRYELAHMTIRPLSSETPQACIRLM